MLDMKKRISALMTGLHFRFLGLVVAVAGLMLATQLISDTLGELEKTRTQRLSEALGVTNVIARSLEGQFEFIELDDIESILADVRSRSDVEQLTVVDRHQTFYLDGDLMTSPIVAVNHSQVQTQALETGKTAFLVTDDQIQVAEPLLADDLGLVGTSGTAIGSVMIAFHNPGLTETLYPIVRSKLATILPILLIGLMFAARMVSQITAPLRSLSVAAGKISAGDFECEADPRGAVEIRQLAIAFNQMVGTIKQNISQIYDLAYVDKVTKLPNREFFRRELSKAVSKVMRTNGSGALLFVDLDGFKRINDTFGHDFGDRLLAQFAERITEVVRTGDEISLDAARDLRHGADIDDDKETNLFARLGGDEFTILLPEIREETDAGLVARRLIESVAKSFIIDGKEVNVGASIGIATFPRDGKDYQSILKHADMAMYQAKEEGKNTYRFFSGELNEKASRRMEIETDLRKALERGELELYYQPKIDNLDNSVHGLEALIRWHHPVKGMINPGEFIAIAEDCGLILPLGEYVIDTACRQIRRFMKSGKKMAIAVNISTQQFEKPEFATRVQQILTDTKADPNLLELEITESMAMSDPDMALDHIRALKKIGVRFAIDDFGTGYSNLAQLSRMPFDVFKIDRSFVMTLDANDANGEAIVRTIIAMAHSLKYETVAEGVETEAQAKALKEAGCRIFQGYLYAKPMCLSDLEIWLEDQGKAKAAA
jgi:predicted signal transduction protein with EAL and GGDEF domain